MSFCVSLKVATKLSLFLRHARGCSLIVKHDFDAARIFGFLSLPRIRFTHRPISKRNRHIAKAKPLSYAML